jgi:hypothetical protein
MSNKKQTAVQWLISQQKHNQFFDIETIEIAKEMEKEQIEEAYKYARAHWSREDGNAERYYKETYAANK